MSNTIDTLNDEVEILYTLFGDKPYCEHGTTAFQGVCQSCVNPTVEYGKVIYISSKSMRDMV